jgi:hypothetical protein
MPSNRAAILTPFTHQVAVAFSDHNHKSRGEASAPRCVPPRSPSHHNNTMRTASRETRSGPLGPPDYRQRDVPIQPSCICIALTQGRALVRRIGGWGVWRRLTAKTHWRTRQEPARAMPVGDRGNGCHLLHEAPHGPA